MLTAQPEKGAPGRPPGAPALQLSGVTKSFPGRRDEPDRLVLEHLNIHVAPGEFVTLLGPSGCGKSTIFNLVAGLLAPTTGEISVDGESITGKPGHVGYMFQKDVLLPWRTVEKNLLIGPQVFHRSMKEARAETTQTLERLGLSEFARHYPAQLSGGMRQRAAFGRTLLFHKEILLLDEPLGALDSQTREEMQEWLLEVWEELNRTILLVSHDIEEAIFLSDRVYVMSPRPGRIKAEVEIDLPRPRARETRLKTRFDELRHDLYRLVRAEES